MSMMKIPLLLCFFLLVGVIGFTGCVEEISREDAIPDDAIKVTPETDRFPPVLHLDGWEDPIPMEGPVNTRGGEDACFITPDGNTFFFFFTPDVSVPANEQLSDGVTGIWWCTKQGSSWTEPERVQLGQSVALDGAPFYQDTILWFASFRVGNYRDDGDICTAHYVNGQWTEIKNTGSQLNDVYNIGEMHLSNDGNTIYFHGENPSGDTDLYTTTWNQTHWDEPVTLGAPVNTELDDSRPFVTTDGTELWFTRPSMLGYTGPAVYRSLKKPDGSWSEPVEIASNFAAEPTLDAAGNLYFGHHFFDAEMNMIEADIYVCYAS